MAMPVAAWIVPELWMPPLKVAIVTLLALLPTRMPTPPAVTSPLLLMPPANADIVTSAREPVALPPTQMPLAPAEIVPELAMPPPKVEIIMEATWLGPPAMLAVPPSQMPLAPAE